MVIGELNISTLIKSQSSISMYSEILKADLETSSYFNSF